MPSTQRITQAELCLAKSSKAVYWTLVQYEQGYRSLMEIEIRSTQIRLRHKASDGSVSPEADRPFEFGGTWEPDSGRGRPEMGHAKCRMRGARSEIGISNLASRTKTRRDYNFFSSFLTSAFTFSQKDSFGAFLHPSMRTGTIFSIPATLTPALSGLPPWP
jgi:hypothetical protein